MICYINDVLVTGSTVTEHLEIRERVLEGFQQYNLQAKKSKCSFLSESVQYLGHRLGADRLHVTDQNVAAVKRAPRPRNVREL